MYRVGEVVRTAQGLAVVRSPDAEHAEIGTEVLDDELTDVGRVVDVFGPVEQPYLAVTPEADVHLPGLVGRVLYAR
ncbi:H/ACA ribonucleoprotein complex subunit GAR1 [Natrialbaceae archaeon AArc-T1-2]|uniref:H/ACA ribonucleoprotein complex subunit GAR1 n=1 Tax=Natrialbaceae archaeon AArc-T1-2 TaxID=3053904 RepID=UPI00255B1F35|nr:Gar1/Naf1 family protein [Natrialbaceae archaeon AArc-T1-2]WIV66096.1 Gar1/Naf1 family protein [Natrialbaceae archaeon AArc-T1-2]